ncbi:AmmeMemoRadiSam system protein B [Desulfosarcina sp. OttesenSCG-928-A07]|nr:AmmeMemoRadiSam system protein B [Desulfosarcina sp. OttesenSCG-928-G17]MDL2329793.1 AmmeMemoRadiSam system protein B [Desulfosarcina sp. OttesenSCG-928-A07]
MQTRKAVFSGSWYPAEAQACKALIREFLGGEKCPAPSEKPLVGGIVPHAGWFFSGAIACRVIHCLASGCAPNIDVVVVFGMHLHPGSSRYIMPEGQWETPFGPVPVDASLAEAITRRHVFEIETPSRFVQDNTIEVQMPFIRYFFPDSRVVAMGVPPVVETLNLATDLVSMASQMGLSIVVVGSTDLTHYGPNYRFTPKGQGSAALSWVREENDRRVIEVMARMDPVAVLQEGIHHANACCSGAAAAAIAAGKAMGADLATTVAYATSYDKRPDDSFVGYAGMLF